MSRSNVYHFVIAFMSLVLLVVGDFQAKAGELENTYHSSGVFNDAESYNEEKAFDDDLETKWVSAQAGSDAWLSVEYSEEVLIDKIVLIEGDAQRYLKDYVFQYHDGNSWVDIPETRVTNGVQHPDGPLTVTFEFDPIQTKQIKLQANAFTGRVYVTELKINYRLISEGIINEEGKDASKEDQDKEEQNKEEQDVEENQLSEESQSNGIGVTINGKAWSYDEPLVMRNYRLLISPYDIKDALGAKVIEEASMITIVKGDTTIIVKTVEPFAQVNGEKIELDQAAEINDGSVKIH